MRYTYYRKDYFLPVFTPTFPPNAGIGDPDVEQVCHGDPGCTFDYKATLSSDVARDTLDMQAWDTQIKGMSVLGKSH